jgi:hypothetical protein
VHSCLRFAALSVPVRSCFLTAHMLRAEAWGTACCAARSLPAGAVAKVLQAAQAAETLPLDAGLELERCAVLC